MTRFERRFAEYLGRQHALGVTSCTGALHMSLLALGIGAGDEVITTPMTFPEMLSSRLEVSPRMSCEIARQATAIPVAITFITTNVTNSLPRDACRRFFA